MTSRGNGDARSARLAHLVSGRRLTALAEAICRVLAPDVATGAFYVVLRPDLPPEYQGGEGGPLALTSRHLDLMLRPTLERQRRWRGRGPAILLDPVAIATDAARRPRASRRRVFPRRGDGNRAARTGPHR